MCLRRQRGRLFGLFLIEVLIGLSPRFFVCCFVFLSIGIIWGEAQWALGEHPPSLRQVRRGREGWVCLTEACMLGLSDFASKGEQCDASVCKEGPSGWGSAEELCSGTWARLGQFFLWSSPTLLGHALNTVFCPFVQPFWGPCCPCEYAGVIPHRSVPSVSSSGIDCWLAWPRGGVPGHTRQRGCLLLRGSFPHHLPLLCRCFSAKLHFCHVFK